MSINFFALNEVNFDLYASYEGKLPLKGLSKLKHFRQQTTYNDVPHEYLEPWIQWVTVHTGLPPHEHNVFRLDDVNNGKHEQLFEYAANNGFSVCAISPMNSINKLPQSHVFIPDPWTSTHSDNSFWSRKLHKVLRQVVNDNASGKISLSSYIFLALAFFRFVKPKWYPIFFRLFAGIKSKKWNKALILDLLLYNVFLSKRGQSNKDFNYLFLNCFAHIQHHYMFNSSMIETNHENPGWYIKKHQDPVEDAVIIYDMIIFDFLVKLQKEQLFIATGLSQSPYPTIKFYYRLQNHENFLTELGIKYARVRRGMTRDFHVDFSNAEQKNEALKLLKDVSLNGEKIFGDFTDEGLSIFCSLRYPKEIMESDAIIVNGKQISLYDFVDFVAIKNGEHTDKGYFFCNVNDMFDQSHVNLSEVHNLVKKKLTAN